MVLCTRSYPQGAQEKGLEARIDQVEGARIRNANKGAVVNVAA